MKLIPFDLQIALKHPERVRHVSGKSAIRVAHFPEASAGIRVWIHLHGNECPNSYTEDGRYVIGHEPVLFLTAETKLVPWELHEIPVGSWFRVKGTSVSRTTSEAQPGSVWVGEKCLSTKQLLDHYEHSPHPFAPDSEWKPCGKEVEA